MPAVLAAAAASAGDGRRVAACLELAALIKVLVASFGSLHDIVIIDSVAEVLMDGCRHLLQQNFFLNVVGGDSWSQLFYEFGQCCWSVGRHLVRFALPAFWSCHITLCELRWRLMLETAAVMR